MVIMAEGDSGVILMPETPKSHNGTVSLDSTMTSDSDSESASTFATQSFGAVAKRNKRKNFQPRNIAYSENESTNVTFSNRDRTTSDSSESDYVLDLSNLETAISVGKASSCSNSRRQRSSKPRRNVKKSGGDEDGDGDDDDDADANVNEREHGLEGAMDLTCSKNASPYPYNHVNSYYSDSDSDSDDSKMPQQKRRKTMCESSAAPYFLHSYMGQTGDASDLKEYAQNTVKELLEICGLNSDAVTDVAQTITNNIPISNFSSGKILESLSALGDRGTAAFLLKNRTSPKSEISSPPRSPNANVATRENSVPNSVAVSHASSKPKTDQSFSKQIGNRFQPSIFTTNSGMAIPQNMAAILAVASIKEQLKMNSNSSSTGGNFAVGFGIGGEINPNVTITPSGLSPNFNAENSNNSNSGSLIIRRVPSASSPSASASKENRVQQMQTATLQQTVSNQPVDYSRYVKRYSTASECGSSECKSLNYREHFHCLECDWKVFIKKEEMIRHFKWHKKRHESLQHGFMRYSPSDDCSERFPNCTHNRKQTHYHCIQYVAQGTCDKVYISTSDVQMHANYHRKDSAIIQEGFQRLRATEECRTPYCTFFGQRTTHFHCRRENCQFTFKNKADMEKHKTYHIRDEQLAKDGFKKFLKPDSCGFVGCRFSQMNNHIHCVREGCNYVLHSSGQLLSHKRKHERKDNENVYRKFKLSHQNVATYNGADQLSQYSDKLLLSSSSSSNPNSFQLFQQSQLNAPMNSSVYSAIHENNYSNSSSEGPTSPSSSAKLRNSSAQLSGGGYFTENFSQMDFSQSEDSSEYWYRYISHFSANDVCPPISKCLMHGSDHYHCKEANCDLSFKTKEVAESHARQHEAQERLCEQLYQEGAAYCHEESCPREKHYHCTWDGCYEAILPSERFEHLKNHEFSSSQFNSLDALFRRKRGRPPKNRVIEVWNEYSGAPGSDSPQAIFTSFKLPKPSAGSGGLANNLQQSEQMDTFPPLPDSIADSPKHHIITQTMLEQYKFEEYGGGCPDPLCRFTLSSSAHYHCKRPRCFFATNAEEQLPSHAVDFHENVQIADGFLFFDSSVDCRRENCQGNKVSRHFHCVRPSCDYSFVRYSEMTEHNLKHQKSTNASRIIKDNDSDPTRNEHNSTNTTADTANCKSSNVVKASGTFYPLCGLSNTRCSSPTGNNDEKSKFEPVVQIESEPALTPPMIASPLLNLLPEWLQMDTHLKYTTEKPCCRAFCKLKRKDHYHCNACNQAFSELDKLKQHVVKHNNSSISPFMLKAENNNNSNSNNKNNNNNNNNNNNTTTTNTNNTNTNDDITSDDGDEITRSAGVPTTLPLSMDSPYQAGFGAAMAAAQQLNLAMMTSQGISFISPTMSALYTSPSGLMFTPPHAFPHPHPLLGNELLLDSLSTHPVALQADPVSGDLAARKSLSPQQEMSAEMKKARIQTSMRILKDEPVPEGYLRFRFNEDCHYTSCGYREHQTHFHCVRHDCGYSFCDKTRFVQHTARHERLDTLMGGDFQQYRANISCGRNDCAYAASIGSSQNKASHFHCLKCDFVCTDTNKVVAHRRQHQKLDSINAAGFEKYTPAQACNQPDCSHSGKQTHYHCLSCQYAVLGLSQMSAHKYKHLE